MRGLVLPAAMCSIVHGEQTLGTPQAPPQMQRHRTRRDADGFLIATFTHEPEPQPDTAWAEGGYPSGQVGHSTFPSLQQASRIAEKTLRYPERYGAPSKIGGGWSPDDPVAFSNPGRFTRIRDLVAAASADFEIDATRKPYPSVVVETTTGVELHKPLLHTSSTGPASKGSDCGAAFDAPVPKASPQFETAQTHDGFWFVRRKADHRPFTGMSWGVEALAIAQFFENTNNAFTVEVAKDRVVVEPMFQLGKPVIVAHEHTVTGEHFVHETYHCAASTLALVAPSPQTSENGTLISRTLKSAPQGGSYIEVRRQLK